MWIDRRRFIIWLFPTSSAFIVGLTLWSAFVPYMVYMEGFGQRIGKKIAIILIFIVIVLVGIYACIGIYQVFFIELRRKFIVSKVVPLGKRYYLKGYYFKKAEFNGNEVATVVEYNVKKGFGKNIATLLAKAPQTKTHNYKIVLKDGREFYLPAEMWDVDGLVRELGGNS